MEASKSGQARTAAGTSPWVALLPLGFIAVGIGAIGFAASLSVRARPAPLAATPVPAVVEPISRREEARLAEQITAFALTKVGPERFEVEPRAGIKRPPIVVSEAARTNAKLAQRKIDNKTEKPAVKVATVLPPPRPAIIMASAAPPRPSLIPVGFGPSENVEPKPGVLAQMANYVPSPRRILSDAVSDAWSLGGKVGKLIPKI
jgi:hypothetical protein